MVDEAVNLDLSAAFAAIDDLVARIVDQVKAAGDQASAELTASLESASSEIDVSVGDTSAVTDEIAAAVAAAPSEVDVTANAAAVTDDVTAAVGDADTTIDVEVGNADEISSTISQAVQDGASGGGGDSGPSPVPEETTASFLNLANAVSASRVASSAAVGDTAALGAGMSALGGSTAVAGGGIVAFVGVLGKMIQEGSEAQHNLDLFNDTFGKAGEAFQQLNFGGLNTDLRDLAVSLGSDDDAILGTVARMAVLGQQAGQTNEQILSTNQQFVALAARAVALNPSLGSIEDVLQRLPIALSRGGRFATQLGINLTQSQIAAEAAAEGISKPVAELSVYEKAALGATVATRQLGDSLGQDIARGQASAVQQLRSFRQEIREGLEQGGQALISAGALDTVKQLAPVLQQLLGVITRVGVALFEVLGPIAGPLLRPVVDVLKAINLVITPLIPLLHGLAVAIGAVLNVVGQVLVPFEKLIDLANKLPDAFGAVGHGISVAAGAAEDLFTSAGNATGNIDDMSRALGDAGVTVEAGKVGLQKYTDEVVAAKALADKYGISLKQLRGVADDLGVSWTDLTAVEAELNRQRGNATDATNFYTASVSDAAQASDDLSAASKGTGAFFDAIEQGAYQAAHALTDFEIAQGNAAAAAIGAPVNGQLFAGLAAGVESVNAALVESHGIGDQAFAALLKAGPQATDIVRTLADGLQQGGLSMEDFQSLAERTGTSLDDLGAIEQRVRDQTDEFGKNVAKSIGDITDATQNLDDQGKAHVTDFVRELQKQALDAAAFSNSISTLFARGANELAEAFIAAGPEAASAAAEAAQASDAQLATFESNVAQTKTLFGEAQTSIDTYAGQAITKFGEIGDAANKIPEGLQDSQPDIDAAILGAQAKLDTGQADAYQKAYAIGTQVGAGEAAGIRASADQVASAILDTNANAMQQAQHDLGIASPSRVFATEIGIPITEGIAEGIRSGFFAVDDAIGDVMRSLQQSAKDQLNNVFDALKAGQSLKDAQDRLADTQQKRADLAAHQVELKTTMAQLRDQIAAETTASEAVTAREQQAINRAQQNLDQLTKQFQTQQALPGSIADQQRLVALTSSDLADLDARLAEAQANLALGTGSQDAVQAAQQARDAKQREVDSATSQLDKLNSQMSDNQVTTIDLQVAQEDLNDAIAESHAPTQKLTELQQQLKDAQADQTQTAKDLAQATKDITDEQLNLLEAYERAAEAGQVFFDQGDKGQDILRAIGDAAGFSAGQVQSLVDQFANFAVITSQTLGGAGAPNSLALTPQPIDVFGTGVSFANSVQDAIAQVNFVRGQAGQGAATAADLAQFPWMHNTFNIYNQDPQAVATAVTNRIGLGAVR